MDKKIMFVGSVSGNFFAWQLAAIVTLERSYFRAYNDYIRPDVCMGSSGGAVSLLIASGSSWNPEFMIERASAIDGEDLFKHFDKIMSCPPVAYIRHGSMYKPITDIDFLIDRAIPSPASLNDQQFIVGTYCKKDAKSCYFTNKISVLNADTMIVTKSHHDLVKSVVASCSIPIIMPEMFIEGKSCQDGGTYSASPLHDFAAAITMRREKLQMLYFGSRQEPHSSSIPLISELLGFLNSNYKKDEELAIAIITNKLKRIPVIQKNVNMSKIASLFATNDDFIAIIYPITDAKNFDMLRFKGTELSNIMNTFTEFNIVLYA